MDSEDALLEQAQRRLGSVLCGKYTVEKVLGVGGMAVVYAATHRNQKKVAIKMLHPQLSTHAEIRKRFLREGYVANSVKHKGAVDVIDDDVAEDGAAFIVMEYLDGMPVDALANARGGRLPPTAAIAIVHELCAVLAAAHASEIVHRDIKPANIFVTTDGELKVLDFGIARLRDSSSGQATNTGMMLGTPAFMAPEQARGQTPEVGAATDIWAAGATLFNLLSGENVHTGDTAQMVMIHAATNPPRSLAAVMPDLAPEIVAVVDRALQFGRSERWETAASMRTALREAHLQAYGDLSITRTLAPLVGGEAPEGSERPPSTSARALVAASTVMAPHTPSAERFPPTHTQRMAAPTPIGATTGFPVTSSFVKPLASKRSVGLGIAAIALASVGVAVALGGKSTPGPVNGSALVQSSASPSVDRDASAAPSVAPEVKPVPLQATIASTTPTVPAAPIVPLAGASPTSHGPRATRPADVRAPSTIASSASAPPPVTNSAPAPRPLPPPSVDPGSIR